MHTQHTAERILAVLKYLFDYMKTVFQYQARIRGTKVPYRVQNLYLTGILIFLVCVILYQDQCCLDYRHRRTYPVLLQFRICIGQFVQLQVNDSLAIPLGFYYSFTYTEIHSLEFMSLYCLLSKPYLLQQSSLFAWAYIIFQIILISSFG